MGDFRGGTHAVVGGKGRHFIAIGAKDGSLLLFAEGIVSLDRNSKGTQ